MDIAKQHDIETTHLILVIFVRMYFLIIKQQRCELNHIYAADLLNP